MRFVLLIYWFATKLTFILYNLYYWDRTQDQIVLFSRYLKYKCMQFLPQRGSSIIVSYAAMNYNANRSAESVWVIQVQLFHFHFQWKEVGAVPQWSPAFIPPPHAVCSFPSTSLSSFVLWARNLGGVELRIVSSWRKGAESSAEIKGVRQRSKPSLRILYRGRRRDSSEKPSTWSTHSGTAEYGHMGDRVSPVRVSHTKRKGASVGPLSVVRPLARDAKRAADPPPAKSLGT